MARNISKKRKFVADGVFFAELSEVRFVFMVCGEWQGTTGRRTPSNCGLHWLAMLLAPLIAGFGMAVGRCAVVTPRITFFIFFSS
jgi:hypothetical protein